VFGADFVFDDDDRSAPQMDIEIDVNTTTNQLRVLLDYTSWKRAFDPSYYYQKNYPPAKNHIFLGSSYSLC
jgi:hypothetical protein